MEQQLNRFKQWSTTWSTAWPTAIAALLLLLLFSAYLYNLTGWQIFDDEGEYLYQVWRMSHFGEMPYRDFLTPQLPVYLYLGSLVMWLSGPSLFIMRLYSLSLAFLSAILLYIAGKRHGGWLTGLLAMGLFLGHADVFKETRIFRNEPLFLLFVTLGVVIATWPHDRSKRSYLRWAGVCFGLATMVKLFGLLPLGGVGLWLIWEWGPWRPSQRANPSAAFWGFFKNGWAVSWPALLVLLVLAGGFSLWEPEFFELVVGHHLAQGSEQATTAVLQRQFALYWEYFTFNPLFVGAALISAVLGLWQGDVRQRWAWQLPIVLPFLALSRQFGPRHFMVILPALSLLTGWLIARGLTGRYHWWGRIGLTAALIVMVIPWFQHNSYRAGWQDDRTPFMVDLIQQHTQEGEAILSDDIGLAYYARRPTTYSGAALSNGAATSGQITGEILIDEIVADDVRMVIIDSSLLTGNHMVFLRDYPRFHRFLENNFHYNGRYRRDFQELDVWVRDGSAGWQTADSVEIPSEDGTRFGPHMRLLGYELPATIQAGDTLHFKLYWTATAPAENYWSIFTHLVGPEGRIVAQQDKISYDGVYPPNRWWPGQIIDDRFAIQLPADAPPGDYHIAVGMYDWQTGERLSLTSATGQKIPDNRRILPQPIELLPAE